MGAAHLERAPSPFAGVRLTAYHPPMSIPERCCGRCRWYWNGQCNVAVPGWVDSAGKTPGGYPLRDATPYSWPDCSVFEQRAVASVARLDE